MKKLQVLKKAIEETQRTGYYFSDHTAARLMKKALQNKLHEIENGLTDEELEFIKHICTDKPYKEIAKTTCMYTRHVEYLREKLFKHFSVKCRSALAVKAMKEGLTF